MRTNIVLNDALVEKALSLTGARSKRELVELALKELIAHRAQEKLLKLSKEEKAQLIDEHYTGRSNAGTG